MKERLEVIGVVVGNFFRERGQLIGRLRFEEEEGTTGGESGGY